LRWMECQTEEGTLDLSVFEDYFPKMLENFKMFHAQPTEFLGVKDKEIVIGNYYGVSNYSKNSQCHSVVYIYLR